MGPGEAALLMIIFLTVAIGAAGVVGLVLFLWSRSTADASEVGPPPVGGPPSPARPGTAPAPVAAAPEHAIDSGPPLPPIDFSDARSAAALIVQWLDGSDRSHATTLLSGASPPANIEEVLNTEIEGKSILYRLIDIGSYHGYEDATRAIRLGARLLPGERSGKGFDLGYRQYDAASEKQLSKELSACLLDAGADVNYAFEAALTMWPETALNTLAGTGDIELIGLLLERGADPNIGPTAHIAAGRNRVDVLELLVAHGADLQTPDGDGASPLRWAISRGALEAVEWLLENGLDANEADCEGKLPLTYAIECRNRPDGDRDGVVELLEGFTSSGRSEVVAPPAPARRYVSFMCAQRVSDVEKDAVWGAFTAGFEGLLPAGSDLVRVRLRNGTQHFFGVVPATASVQPDVGKAADIAKGAIRRALGFSDDVFVQLYRNVDLVVSGEGTAESACREALIDSGVDASNIAAVSVAVV